MSDENKVRVLLGRYYVVEEDIEYVQRAIRYRKEKKEEPTYCLPNLTIEENKKRIEDSKKRFQYDLWLLERRLEFFQWLNVYVGGALDIIQSMMPDCYNVLKLVYIDRGGYRDEPVKALLSKLGMTPKIYRRIRNEAMQRFLDLCPVDEAPFPESPTSVTCKLKPGYRHS
jgi:hypothetical protein